MLSNTVGIILTAAILYDFLFRTSISFNMMFLWNIDEILQFIYCTHKNRDNCSSHLTAILRTLIGLVPAVLIAIPLFGVSAELGIPLVFLLLALYLFGITLGLLVTSGLLRYGPSFENIAWASLFFLAPLGCIYYPIEILPETLQIIAKGLPLVHIFEEMRSILMNNSVNYFSIIKSISISLVYFVFGVIIFYISYFGAKKRGTLINMGE